MEGEKAGFSHQFLHEFLYPYERMILKSPVSKSPNPVIRIKICLTVGTESGPKWASSFFEE